MLRLRRRASVALSISALVLTLGCVDNGREPVFSQVTPIPDATPDIPQNNQNISDPTLEIPRTFPVMMGQEPELVWSEEFNGNSIDPEKWFFATGDGDEQGLPPGWGNNELQYYLPDNASVEGGILTITAKRESIAGFNYTSARLNTQDRFAFKYGRIEASIRLPAGQGLWPAFWMLSQDSPYGSWAATGEIDIMEAVNLGGVPRQDVPPEFAKGGGNNIFGTIYYGGEFPNQENTSVEFTPSVDVTAGFNLYAVEWEENEIRWYFNDTLYAVQNNWFSTAAPYPAPFDQPFHILLNLAVGGEFPGQPDSDLALPAEMKVDYVRVYSGGRPGDILPEGVVYATDPDVEEDLAPPAIDNFGSGAVFDTAYAMDDAFNPAIQVTSGEGYGAGVHVGFIAFNGYAEGFAQNFENLVFKVKGDEANLDEWEVKFINGGDTSVVYDLTTYEGATDIGDGWLQVEIPMSDFIATTPVNSGFLIGPLGNQGAPFSYLLTDIGFTGFFADHGPGTAGVFTETMTEAPITVTGFTNSIDFGGNNTVANPMSMAVPAPEGSVVLEVDYQDSGSSFGGVLLGFGSVDLTAYDTLNFTIDTSGIADFGDLTVQIEPPGAGAAGTNVLLSAYTPVMSGNWATYAIPLADFPATTFDTAANLGFWNPKDSMDALAFGTVYIDDVYFSTEGGAGDSNLVTNGDLETGDTTGWVTGAGDGTVGVSTDNPSSGMYSLNYNIAYAGSPAPAPGSPTSRNENVGMGVIEGNQAITVSIDVRGTINQPGAAFNILLFTQVDSGTAPPPDTLATITESIADWETRTYNITTDPNATSVTLQMNAGCGDVDGCSIDMFVDNVSITID